MTLSRANTFPQVFSQLAGMDCLTKGLGGSCFAEKCVHPSTEGHLMMGYNLYDSAKMFLKK